MCGKSTPYEGECQSPAVIIQGMVNWTDSDPTEWYVKSKKRTRERGYNV
jgi:hypothetical protein